MTTVQVLFPVLRGMRRFHIQKGRRWSVIEHLLLDVVSREPGTASDFAAKSSLPRRVIVEAFIRLMRAGWVEITVVQGSLIFRATPLGMEQASLDDLPTATITEAKKRGFVIEQITGGVFRSRELDVRANHLLPVPSDVELVIRLPEVTQPADAHPSEVFTAIEGEDELIVGVDPGEDRLVKSQAVVTVRDGVIEGLPARASPALRNLVLAEAAKAFEAAQAQKASKKSG